MSKKVSWVETGAAHIWHPYTQMQIAPDPVPVVSASGTQLTLADGRTLIDGLASWWSTCHGYNHPALVEAMQTQLQQMSHVMFAGIAHEPAYRLASELAAITPKGLERVFFSDSGSTAVEVAMKMAVQYWRNIGVRGRDKFISFKGGYHGDTMGAMSLCDPEKGMHKDFGHYMPRQYVIDLPSGEYSFAEFEQILESFHKTVAGVIIEPLVQGAGGMLFHSPDVLAEIHRLCKQHNVLFIADEVATGFGRTGLMFACDEAGISPDIMCLGKGLTGGMCTMGATLASEDIFTAFLSDRLEDCFMHGPTYMANPLACAAALASIALFKQEPRLEQVAAIEKQLWEGLSVLSDCKHVHDIRVRGAIGVVEFKDSNWEKMFAMRQACIKQGVWLRPFGNIVYLTPAFTITEDELRQLIDVVVDLVMQWS